MRCSATLAGRRTLLLGACLALGSCGGGSSEAPPDPNLSGDPLFAYQWHLHNTGQDAFASNRPTAGVDLNLATLHQDNVRGAGIEVAVIDSGLDIRHEDLLQNVVPQGSLNLFDQSDDPTPVSALGDHGTSVAGLIAARGWNGVGGRGVAPEAQLRGFNYLEAQGVSNYLNAMGLHAKARQVQVFNMSFGMDIDEIPPLSRSEQLMMDALYASTRNGKGGIYLQSSGNGFGAFAESDCSSAQLYGVGCQNTAFSPEGNTLGLMQVAAVNADGKRSSYSTPGSAVLVSGFGGEYGLHRDYITTSSPPAYYPAMITTDLSGCDRGYHRTLGRSLNPLDLAGPSPLDTACNYTASFNGTSSAAPTVSGVAALMLQVNPNLSQRDLRYILATTSRAIDFPGKPLDYEGTRIDDAWVINKAGRPFNNWYGFGLVDAQAAVAAARKFVALPPLKILDWQQTDDADVLPIPYRDTVSTSGSLSLEVKDNVKIEQVQVAFSTTNQEPSKLRVKLTSPSGTQSILIWPFSGLADLAGGADEGFSSDRISSNAFLDEDSQGNWELEILDISQAAGVSPALFEGWALRILGR